MEESTSDKQRHLHCFDSFYSRLSFRRFYSKPACYLTYVFLVIVMLGYDLLHTDSTIFLRSTNEATAIERVLQQLPVCSTDDRSRQRALLYTLQQWTHLAHSQHVRYWISHETLLGYVRFHRLLPHVRTIDLSILADETPALVRLAQRNFSSIYQLKIPPQWSNGSDARQFKAQFLDRRTNLSINLWPVYAPDETLLQFESNAERQSVPENWIFPLQPCIFSGMKVWCPTESKMLVEALYHSTRTEQMCHDGIWFSPSLK